MTTPIDALLTWRCHVCGEERLDRFISVYSEEHMLNERLPFRVNVRYCNDREDCTAGASNVAKQWMAAIRGRPVR